MNQQTETQPSRNVWAIVGAINGALAVALGAFGAHGLETMVEEGRLAAEMLETFETAVRYQMYHALALVALGALVNRDCRAGKAGRLCVSRRHRDLLGHVVRLRLHQCENVRDDRAHRRRGIHCRLGGNGRVAVATT